MSRPPRIRAGEEEGLTAHYSPGQERPLGAYAALVGTFATSLVASIALLKASGRELPDRTRPGDIVLIGVATHKLSRLIAKDRVTSFLRAPFTRFQESSGQGEVEEEPYGQGLRLAIGELLVCPYCLTTWVAAGFTLGELAAPRSTRLLRSILVAQTISDFLQAAYRAAEDQG